MKELAKTYNPKEIEERIYANWVDKKYFHAEPDKEKKPFTIVIPPPNITGQLHMGHALDNTMQDILIRYKRMQGYNALWQPGTDHASIATEVKIIETLKKQGIDKHDLGREGFLERAWEWKKQYGGTIIKQLKKLGSSCDWDRERFTMDEGCNKAVEKVFVDMYEKGWIYKGSRIVNWCPVCNTSISDAEVEYEEQQGNFWHIKYQVEGTDEYLEFATTRPETMLGDTAIAVHPDDERYAHLVGKMCVLPFVGRSIPIIADTYVEKDFGTGVVKITPAHDPNDFEVGKRHNLPEINIMNDDATINSNGGKFEGMDRYEARKQIVKELDEMGLLVKIEPYSHNVGTHDRCKTTVEPLIKKQWFVKMDELIKPAVEAVKTGEIKLVPERMNKTYFNWTDNIRDWCISRQLWWGHRIPAYYCPKCGKLVVARKDDAPEVCPDCGAEMTQDPDTLDTWFSSALWPFSTLGWPEKTEDLEYFYPTDVLVTGYDIIFFWVIRMIFSGYEQMKAKPFNTVLFHGLVRDSQGRKMSKSLGNGIDPLEIIDKFGADALRFTLITGNAPGNDMRFYNERVEASRNFANKVWNASRFIMMNIDQMKEKGLGAEAMIQSLSADKLEAADRWILSKVNTLAKTVTDNLDKFELGVAASQIYSFIWEEFCDWYIEMVKPRLYGDDVTSKTAAIYTLRTVLTKALKLLHPYMPFVTEEIFVTLKDEEGVLDSDPSIMISKWPEFTEEFNFAKEEKEIELLKETVKGVRNIRTEYNVLPSRKAKLFAVTNDKETQRIFAEGTVFLKSLAGASEIEIKENKDGIPEDAISCAVEGTTIFIPFSDLVDIQKELERLDKEKTRLEGEIKRAQGMLANENFVKKAPQNKIDEEKAKLAKYESTYAQVVERIAALNK
ncbi:MAG: valine--tRNA ligase [Lachnospiraceae bacterium]|nr:valine--tRNA ligase [Lachnospiraceae bacterium]